MGLKSAGWILIGAGAVSIVAGLLAIVYPDITLLAFALFAGITLMISSAVSLVDALGSDSDGGSRAVSAVMGVLGLIAGLIVLRRPGETLLVLVLAIGIWLVVSGAVRFVRSFEDLEGRALRMGDPRPARPQPPDGRGPRGHRLRPARRAGRLRRLAAAQGRRRGREPARRGLRERDPPTAGGAELEPQ
jgi:hypothetical protein